MDEFNKSIREYVRFELLSWLAEGVGTTSDYDFRAGLVLTKRAEDERAEFYYLYGSFGWCNCFISPPCCFCVHPGNPVNQEETDECWTFAINI